VICALQRLDEIAARHVRALPAPVRPCSAPWVFHRPASRLQNAALASYLLFEASYTQELMAWAAPTPGSQSRRGHRFFGWTPADAARPARPA
jgi:NTE family protein